MVKDIFSSFLNICTGVLAALALLFVFSLVIIITGSLKYSIFSAIVAVGLSSFVGGIITAALARKNKILLTGINSIVLTLLYFSLFKLEFSTRDLDDMIIVLIIVPSTIAGGFFDLWVNKKSAQRDRLSNPG